MRIYFTFEPRPDLQKPLVEEFPQVEFIFEQQISAEQLAQAQIVVTYGEDLTAELIEQADSLEWLFVASAGIEKMPVQAIADKGIYVTNVRGIHKKPMAESVLAHVLALKRGLPDMYENQAKKQWNRRLRVTELNGSTALILGPGAIGQEIGRILQAFDVHTIGLNSSGAAVPYMNETYPITDLETHLPKADIVLSILPSTEQTKNLITAAHFKAMKSTATFMNFGRGDLFDEAMLIEALETGEIGQAVLDVYKDEPLLPTSKLWTTKNLIVSPHNSSHSSRYLERSLDIFKRSLHAWLAGERHLENEMDVRRGY